MKIALVLNPNAGMLRGVDAASAGEEVATIFRAEGHEVTVEVAAGPEAISAIRRICRQKTVDALVAGGGDGTISAAAAAASESGIALGVLPLGTMNFFARSLGIPVGLKPAAEALANGRIAAIDIATVNGHPFVHVLALGLHPTMVEERQKLAYRSRHAKMLGSARAWWRVIRHPRRFFVSISVDHTTVEFHTAGLVVSNNPLGRGHMPYADRLDQGILGIYVTRAETMVDLVRVTASAAIGMAAESSLVEYFQSRTVDIRLGWRKQVTATIDGELVRLRGPLRVEILPGRLKAILPRAD